MHFHGTAVFFFQATNHDSALFPRKAVTHHVTCSDILMLILSFLLLAELGSGQDVADPDLVLTEHGLLRGSSVPLDSNSTVRLFLGVPYARPPLADLRFRPPEDPMSWTGVKEVTEFPKSCHQRRDDFFADFEGSRSQWPRMESSEDCLYLNVYVPTDLPSNESLPVIIWLPGEGFSTGSSAMRGMSGLDWIPGDPRHFVSVGRVIVVTVQYRLGAFGFAFLDDDGAPGNVGLLDQRKAIQWVRRNIEGFGGNPDLITLGGGPSAALHLLSDIPVRRVILHSSGIQHPWSFVPAAEAFRRTLKLASLVGCPTTGSRQDVIFCLSRKPAEDIVNKELGVVTARSVDFNPFVPTVDGEFITMEPLEQLKRNLREDVSVLIGTNAEEGTKALMYFMPKLFPNTEITSPRITRELFDISVRELFALLPSQVADAVSFQYTNWTDPYNDIQSFKALMEIVADANYNCPVEAFAKVLTQRNANVYKYQFSARDSLDPWPRWTGVKHGDEKDFVFGKPIVEVDYYSIKDRDLSNFIIRSWTNFARLGKPEGKGASKTIGWPKFTENARHRLVLNPDQSYIDSTDDEETCAFWNVLVPKLMKANLRDCSTKQRLRRLEERKFKPLKVKKATTTTTTTSTTTTPTTTTTTELFSINIRNDLDVEMPEVRTVDQVVRRIVPMQAKAALQIDPIPMLQREDRISTEEKGFRVLEPQYRFEESRSPSANNTRLSYRLSVNDAIVDDPNWTLYNSQRPGNSPIYISMDSLEDEEEAPRRPTSAPVRSRTTLKPFFAETGVYDPFTSMTYVRRYIQRSDQPIIELAQKPDQPVSPVSQEDKTKKTYYPNYVPSVDAE